MKLFSKIAAIAISSTFFVINANSGILTGKFGCLSNKNFGGWDALNNGANGSIGVNQLFLIDFDASTSSAAVVIGVRDYGLNSATGSKISATSGTIAITENIPATGIHTVVQTFVVDGNSMSQSFLVIPVNSGNTLMMLKDISNGSNPESGICNRQ